MMRSDSNQRTPNPPHVAEALLACFQRALGHELPSRLVAIQGLLRILEIETPDLAPESRDYLTRATDLARRAHALTRELADLGRAVRTPLAVQPVCVGDAVREAIAETNQVVKGLSAAYHVDPVMDSLTVPWPSLAQVLARLLRHLVQVGSPGPVRVEVGGRVTAAGVEVRLGSNAPAPDQLERLFDPFPAAPASGASELGLFPVRLLVESWGGGLGATADPGLTLTLVERP